MSTISPQEQEQINDSMNSMSIGFLLTDASGNITYSNTAAQLLLAPGDQHPRSASWLHFPITTETVTSALESVAIHEKIMTSITERKPILIPAFAHNQRYLTIHISPIANKHPTANEIVITGTVIIIEDVTQTHELEKMRDELFSIASHELRTPLTAIRGNSSIIQQYLSNQVTDKTMQSLISDIHSASLRLIMIVNDFLQVSRLDQGRMVFRHDRLELPPLIESVLKELKPAADEKKLTLSREPSAAIPPVIADADRLKEVLVNLIGNAIKYTDTGGITVNMTLIPTGDPMVKVSVSDTGRGIPKENHHLLFRKFQQELTTPQPQDKANSTGLGLYIAKLLVDGMGGSIALEASEPQKGSTFSFTLPAGSAVA